MRIESRNKLTNHTQRSYISTAYYARIILDSETRILPCTYPAKTGRRTDSAFARYRWPLDFWLLGRLPRALSRDELVDHSVVIVIRADLYRHGLPLACRFSRLGSRARPRHVCEARADVVVIPMFNLSTSSYDHDHMIYETGMGWVLGLMRGQSL